MCVYIKKSQIKLRYGLWFCWAILLLDLYIRLMSCPNLNIYDFDFCWCFVVLQYIIGWFLLEYHTTRNTIFGEFFDNLTNSRNNKIKHIVLEAKLTNKRQTVMFTAKQVCFHILKSFLIKELTWQTFEHSMNEQHCQGKIV